MFHVEPDTIKVRVVAEEVGERLIPPVARGIEVSEVEHDGDIVFGLLHAREAILCVPDRPGAWKMPAS